MPMYMNVLRLHWFENDKNIFAFSNLCLFAFLFPQSACTKKTNIEFQDDHTENTRKEIDILLTESSKLSNMSFNLK